MQPKQSVFIHKMRATLAHLSGGRLAAVADPPMPLERTRPRLHLVPAALLLVAGIAFVELEVPGLALPFFLGSVYLAGAAMRRLFRGVRHAAPVINQAFTTEARPLNAPAE